MADDEPRDPFLDESNKPWHIPLRKGEMVFLGLAELGNVDDVLEAMKGMSEEDLRCVVLERLYVWHAADVLGALDADDWLRPPPSTP